ncbi:MAG TPA: hypothetical protein VH500_05120 [Nitrososphaeraceae archaeon]
MVENAMLKYQGFLKRISKKILNMYDSYGKGKLRSIANLKENLRLIVQQDLLLVTHQCSEIV